MSALIRALSLSLLFPGPREAALAAAAKELVYRFEALLERILIAPAAAASATAASPSAQPPSPSAADVSMLSASPVARGLEELRRRRAAQVAAAAAAQTPAQRSAGGFGALELPPVSPSGAGLSSMTVGKRVSSSPPPGELAVADAASCRVASLCYRSISR